MCPVPDGKGTRVHWREKWATAKWRGVEKCSGSRKWEGFGGGMGKCDGRDRDESFTWHVTDAEGFRRSHGGFGGVFWVGEKQVEGSNKERDIILIELDG